MKTARGSIATYAETAGARRRTIEEYSGLEPGDPVRSADAVIRAVEADDLPQHLLLGRIAKEMVQSKLKNFVAKMERFRHLSLGADFPAKERR